MTSDKNIPFNQWSCDSIIYVRLLRIDVKHIVIGECFILPQYNLRVVRSDRGTHMTHIDLLTRALRTNPVMWKRK